MAGNQGRDRDIYRRYVLYGWTMEKIAEEYGVTIQRISQIVAEQKARALPSTEEMRQESHELLQEIRQRQLALADLEGAPVTAGKDGDVVIDPETGEVVRDYALRRNALADLVRTDDALSRRFGLDAPGKAIVQQTVRYEIGGLDAEDLT